MIGQKLNYSITSPSNYSWGVWLSPEVFELLPHHQYPQTRILILVSGHCSTKNKSSRIDGVSRKLRIWILTPYWGSWSGGGGGFQREIQRLGREAGCKREGSCFPMAKAEMGPSILVPLPSEYSLSQASLTHGQCCPESEVWPEWCKPVGMICIISRPMRIIFMHISPLSLHPNELYCWVMTLKYHVEGKRACMGLDISWMTAEMKTSSHERGFVYTDKREKYKCLSTPVHLMYSWVCLQQSLHWLQ